MPPFAIFDNWKMAVVRSAPVFYVIGISWTEPQRLLGFVGRLNLLLLSESVGLMSNFLTQQFHIHITLMNNYFLSYISSLLLNLKRLL